MKRKVSRWYVLAGACLVGAVILILAVMFKKTSDTVFTVEGYAITEDHLALYEEDCRAAVTSYYYQTYGEDPNEKGFWEKELDGMTPAEKLRETALDELWTDTVERIEAKKHGIQVPVTLKEIEAALLEENKKRSDTSAVSYGPSQYGLAEYISKTQMKAEDALKEALLKTELVPSEEDLGQLYDSTDKSLFQKGFRAKTRLYLYYGMKVGEYPEELKEIWPLVTAWDAQGMAPDAITEQIKKQYGIDLECEEVEYATDSMPRDNQEIAWLVENTQGKEEGWISEPLNYGVSQAVLKILEMEDYGTADLSEVQDYLVNLWVNQKYPEYLKERMNAYRYSD